MEQGEEVEKGKEENVNRREGTREEVKRIRERARKAPQSSPLCARTRGRE